ncbi:MAG: ATP-dependent Clp protease [Thermodesulfobacteria bacterium]|nr:ATP-dependent Clp protease [Thermodesulfobacteriota bacterium]
MLTNAVKNRPFSVILFDEIEKAHPKIMDIFLQILDDGRLTDSRGQTVFFTEAVIIFTSNIGTRTTTAGGQIIDEKAKLEEILHTVKDPEERAKKVREHFINAVRNFFMHEISRPELLNRIGSNIIAFNYLDVSEVKRKIIQTKLEDLSFNFRDKFASFGHRLIFNNEVVDYFLNKYGKNIEQFGGRGLVNALEDEVAHLLAEQILHAEKEGQKECNFIFYVNKQEELRCRREF